MNHELNHIYSKLAHNDNEVMFPFRPYGPFRPDYREFRCWPLYAIVADIPWTGLKRSIVPANGLLSWKNVLIDHLLNYHENR